MTVRPSSEEILNPRCHHQFIQYPMIIFFLKFLLPSRIKRRWTVRRETDAGPRHVRDSRRGSGCVFESQQGQAGGLSVRRLDFLLCHLDPVAEQLQKEGQAGEHARKVARDAGIESRQSRSDAGAGRRKAGSRARKSQSGYQLYPLQNGRRWTHLLLLRFLGIEHRVVKRSFVPILALLFLSFLALLFYFLLFC